MSGPCWAGHLWRRVFGGWECQRCGQMKWLPFPSAAPVSTEPAP